MKENELFAVIIQGLSQKAYINLVSSKHGQKKGQKRLYLTHRIIR